MKPIIDNINNRYKFELKPLASKNEIEKINSLLYVRFESEISKYNLKKKLNKIKEVLGDENEEIDQELKNSLNLKVNEIKLTIDNTLKKIEKEDHDRFSLFLDFSYKYNDSKNRSDVRNTYEKVIEGILTEAAENFIKYEKLFVLINDDLLDISNKLNINF